MVILALLKLALSGLKFGKRQKLATAFVENNVNTQNQPLEYTEFRLARIQQILH